MLKQWIRNTVINAFIFKVVVPQRKEYIKHFSRHTYDKNHKEFANRDVTNICIYFFFKGDDTFYRGLVSFV